MKAVLMSIQPRWCREIWLGRKTVEVRKSFPQAKDLPYPFKVYIYCTKEKPWLVDIIKEGDVVGYGNDEPHKGSPIFITAPSGEYMETWEQGHVIGEFICDNIESLSLHHKDAKMGYRQPLMGCTCVPTKDLYEYGKSANGGLKELYGWHISGLRKYKEFAPGELSFFGLKRPPQSWCYVKALQSWED